MRDVVVGTAGHIDHGKTLLVKALTGTDADRLPEEKARGITLDIGFATLAGAGASFHFVDLPGHERFIKNMLAGATGVDLCLLVVSADESVMPQTVEHAEILSLLGVRRGVVALTKIDLVDSETRDLALLELHDFLLGQGLNHLGVVPVSAVTGEGIAELAAALDEAAKACPERISDRPFRLPVDRAFTVRGFGTVVTGTCIDGAISAGDRVEVLPGNMSSKVRGLQVFGRSVDRVVSGQRAALNLPEIPYQDLGRGMLAASPGACSGTRLLDVSVRALPSLRHPLKTGCTCTLHAHTQELEAHLHLASLKVLGPGDEDLAQIRTAEAVIAWPGDRFILRLPSPARTVGGGEVLLVASRRARWSRSRDSNVARLLRSGVQGAGLEALLAEAGPLGAGTGEVAARSGHLARNLAPLAASIPEGRVCRWMGGEWWLHGLEAKAWLDRASALLGRRQSSGGPRAWVPRQEVAGHWVRVLGPERSGALLEALLAAGRIEVEGDRVRLAGHKVSLTPVQAVAREAILETLSGAAPVPKSAKELEEAAGPSVRQVLPFMVSDQEVFRFAGDFYLLPSSLSAIRDILARRASEAGPLLSVPQFKDLLGITRKHAMPLLEYLDDLRITRREGDGRRILLPTAREGVENK